MSPVEILKNCIAEKRKEITALEQALEILNPQVPEGAWKDIKIMPPAPSEPVPAPLPAAVGEITPAVAPIRKPKPTGPVCGACGAGMYQTYRTMPSGAQVQLLKCNDSSCGNEAYQ